jgi:hypothetical protein
MLLFDAIFQWSTVDYVVVPVTKLNQSISIKVDVFAAGPGGSFRLVASCGIMTSY